MKKKIGLLLCLVVSSCMLISGCQESKSQTADNSKTTVSKVKEDKKTELEDGIYTVDFDTDSSMFHVSEACNGKGKLTVKDGEMMLHISLASKKIVNLYPGLAEDAKNDKDGVLQPTTDTVTFSDGMTEEVYGFDVPVQVLDKEFDLALIGTKGEWYDHKVSISNPVKEESSSTAESSKIALKDLKDGEYTIDVTLEGGSGKATVSSPAKLTVKDGSVVAKIQWSSSNYDYMKIGSETYKPVNTEGDSMFEIPVNVLDDKMAVIADTTAMGTPHEIEYTLTFHSETLGKE